MRTAEQPTYEQLQTRAEAYCAKREACRLTVRRYLVEKYGAPNAAVKEILAHLVREGFIDERRYAKAYANDKARFNGWGTLKIQAGLAEQGIPNGSIAEALDGINVEEQRAILHKLLESKLRALPCDDGEGVLRNKLLRLAASRGFPYELASSAVEEALAKRLHEEK
jgi:recX family